MHGIRKHATGPGGGDDMEPGSTGTADNGGLGDAVLR